MARARFTWRSGFAGSAVLARRTTGGYRRSARVLPRTLLAARHPARAALSRTARIPAWPGFYFRTAIQLCAGPRLPLMAIAGGVVALARRAFWPLLLLALPPLFYLLEHDSSGGTPIYVPGLWPIQLLQHPLRTGGCCRCSPSPPRRSWLASRSGSGAAAAVIVVLAGTVHWACIPGRRIGSPGRNRVSTPRRGGRGRPRRRNILGPQYPPGRGNLVVGRRRFIRHLSHGRHSRCARRSAWIMACLGTRPCHGRNLFLWQKWAVVKRRRRLAPALRRAARSRNCLPAGDRRS